MDTLGASQGTPNSISCKREWHLPRMNRPDPLPGGVIFRFAVMAVGGKLIALCFQQGQLELKIKARKISGLVMSGKSGGPEV